MLILKISKSYLHLIQILIGATVSKDFATSAEGKWGSSHQTIEIS